MIHCNWIRVRKYAVDLNELGGFRKEGGHETRLQLYSKSGKFMFTMELKSEEERDDIFEKLLSQLPDVTDLTPSSL